jgi:hypothetical protein
MKKIEYDEIIGAMESGLTRATLRILSFHVGKGNTIHRADMVDELEKLGFGTLLQRITFDRHVRAAIAELRKRGELVCSSSGDGGYYLAQERAEYDEFSQVEYRAKIIDMSQTLLAMDQGAARRFGSDTPAEQLGLL